MPRTADIRAVVFDFDGVIADSEAAHERALLETVRSVGMGFTHEQYRSQIIGFDDREAYPAIARLNGREMDPAVAGVLAEQKRLELERMIAAGEIPACPGAIDLARQAALVMPIAICSGALGSEIRLMLRAFGAEALFPVITSAEEVARAKPDPAGYRLTAERLGIDPARCLAIEDTPTGIRAALDAGYGLVVGVCHSLPARELAAAHRVIASTAGLSLAKLLGGSPPSLTPSRHVR